MFMKLFEPGAKTNEAYKKKLEMNMKIDYVMSVVGIITIIVAIIMIARTQSMRFAFIGGVFAGVGFGIIVFSVQSLVEKSRLLKDETKLREARLKASDERCALINQKTRYYAGVVVIGVCYIVVLTAVFFSMEVFWTAWGIIMLYFVSSFIIKKYFEKKF